MYKRDQQTVDTSELTGNPVFKRVMEAYERDIINSLRRASMRDAEVVLELVRQLQTLTAFTDHLHAIDLDNKIKIKE